MTTTFKDPIDFYNYASNFYKSLPKTPAEGKEVLAKVQAIAKKETENMQDVLATYGKIAKGTESPIKDVTAAGKKTAELIKTATFASLIAMPGALFVLPLIVEKAKEFSIDLVPASVAAQFDI